MNKKELIEKYKELENGTFDIAVLVVCQLILKDLELLDEPQPVKVPQFVADWIEEARKSCKDLADFFDFDFTNEEVGKWFMQERPFDLAARAWLDGYRIEEEVKYTVKIKGNLGQYLGRYYLNNEELTPQFIRTQQNDPSYFTKAELEQTGFGWVFDCPGVEVEEVE